MAKKLIWLLLLLTLPLISAPFGFDNSGLPQVSSGKSAFLGLKDTPSTYAGSGNLCVKVNAATSALEFGTCTAAGGAVTWAEVVNGTVYLASNPQEFITWSNAVNGSLLDLATLLGFGYYNITDFNIADYLLVSAWNATNTSYYLETNPYGYYNSTNPQTEVDPQWTDNFTKYNATWSAGVTEPLSLHLNQDNWNNDSSYWIYWENQDTITFNSSKLDTIYYNVTQSDAVVGTIDGGSLQNLSHNDGNYDDITFNFSEEVGSPGLDLRMNFTGVIDFNQGIIRYKTSVLAGDYPVIQLWNYDHNIWEDYPSLAETITFATITQPVFDKSDHLDGGTAQMRLYKASNGNINNHYYVDWVAISKGFGTPSGEEIDPYSYHTDENISATGYNVTADYYFGDGSQLTGLTLVETDPHWTDNFTKYNTTWSSITNTSYYLGTNPFGFYNSTDFNIADYLLVSAWNATNTSYITWGEATNETLAQQNTDVTFNNITGDWFFGDLGGGDVEGSLRFQKDFEGFFFDNTTDIAELRSYSATNIRMGFPSDKGANYEFYHRDDPLFPGDMVVVYGGYEGLGTIRYSHFDGTTWNSVLTFDSAGDLYVAGSFYSSSPVKFKEGIVIKDDWGYNTSIINGFFEINSTFNDKISFDGNQTAPHTLLFRGNQGTRFWSDTLGTEMFGLTNNGNGTFGGNVTADYYFGDGAGLTNVPEPLWTDNFTLYNATWSSGATEPLWTDNFTKYNTTWSSITNTSYYLGTNPFGFYNSTDFNIADYLLVSAWNSTNESYRVGTNNTFTGSNIEVNEFNVTNVSYTTLCNGVNCWRMYVNSSDWFIIEEVA